MFIARVVIPGLIVLAFVVGLTGCGGATQARIYEVGPTLSDRGYERVHVRHSGTDDGISAAQRETFEAELADELAERGFEVSSEPGNAMEIVYRAVSFNAGNTAGRLASAVAGFVSPVGQLGQEIGSGELAVKVEYFDPDGTRVADTVLQQQISGITAHSELTVRAVAGAVAKFAAAKFSTNDRRAVPFEDEAWTGGLPLYRVLEGEWRYAANSLEGETLATGTIEFELHHGGRAVVSTATVDGDNEQPADAISVMFQLQTGRVARWWLDPTGGGWRESSIRLTAMPDGFEYRMDAGDVVTEGRVRAVVGEPLGTIEVKEILRDGTEMWIEVRMERVD
ncbi:MAG: hypothetical protein AAF138_11135 [Planctomycetota bacterium]